MKRAERSPFPDCTRGAASRPGRRGERGRVLRSSPSGFSLPRGSARHLPAVRLAIALFAGVGAASGAAAIELNGNLAVLGQVRDGDQSRKQEAPVDLYGNLGLSDLRHGATVETFFRLEQDLALGYGQTDFYNGSLRVPGAIPGVDFTVGRQFLDEGGGVFVADAGKVRVDLGGPVALTVFGGQPRYFEPTNGPEQLSQDEQIFGGSLRSTRWKNGSLGVGFFQQFRDQHVRRQLITADAARAFPGLPGMPNFYGSMAYDADHQNIDRAVAGVQAFLQKPRLLLNLESSYYKPQDGGNRLVTDIDRREDAIFQVFSLGELLQFRGGLSYILRRGLSAFGDYSYQSYERIGGQYEHGHIGSAGVLWLPGGDGLEVVKVEYYVADSHGGNVNGGRVYYENRVYDRLFFRWKFDVSGYDKASHENDTALAGLFGVGCVFAPGLSAESYLEANRNQRFDADIRFGFRVVYNLRPPGATSGVAPEPGPAPAARQAS